MQRDNARSESIAPPVHRPSRDDDDDALARKRVAIFTTKRDKRRDPMEDAIEWLTTSSSSAGGGVERAVCVSRYLEGKSIAPKRVDSMVPRKRQK